MRSEPSADALFLSPVALISIRVHLAAAYPLEGCGFLVGIQNANRCLIDRAVPARNAAVNAAAQRFVADPRDLLALEKSLALSQSKERVIGFFHSHPDAPAQPSAFDLECAAGLHEVARFKYVYIIAEVAAHEMKALSAWRLNESCDAFIELPLS